MEVNYIRQLTAALIKFAEDDRLNPTHVSLYLALFQNWNLSRFKNPVSISRADAMQLSKIGSKATYHKCIKDLHNWGYLKYMPSHNPYKGSQVYMFIFETSTKQAVNQGSSKSGQPLNQASTKSEQALVPSINSKNNKQDKRKKTATPSGLDEVKEFFKEAGQPASEAEKYFNYYTATGWKVGKTKMEDWPAAARNWIIKTNERAQVQKQALSAEAERKRDNLHASTDKNYDQPL